MNRESTPGFLISNKIKTRKMTYIHYNKKEQNTTVGMPTLAPVELVEGEESTKTRTFEEPLTEDIYAFIAVAPVRSYSFGGALYIILLKYLVYSILISGITFNEIHHSEINSQVVKFLLLPVAISMQEDLMSVYAMAANLQYDEKVLKACQSATFGKLVFSVILRFIDGFLSLSVNFLVMLKTHEVLDIMLNFAALHFLQSIDDVFYGLALKGFFGDMIEHMSTVCEDVCFPRRSANDGFVRNLDSILFVFTLLICLVAYGFVADISDPFTAPSMAPTNGA